MHEAAARIHDIGHVAVTLVCIWLDQWFWQPADYLRRVVTIEQEGADAVFSHQPHAVADYQPAGLGFDRRPTIAQLDELPGKLRLQNKLHGVPEMEIVGEHHVDVLRVLP